MNGPRLIVCASVLAFSGCGGAGAIDDIARSLASKTKYGAPELDDALRSADNIAPLTDVVAREVSESPAVGYLMDAADVVASVACEALNEYWVDPVLPDPDEFLTTQLKARRIVAAINAESISAAAVKYACATKESLGD